LRGQLFGHKRGLPRSNVIVGAFVIGAIFTPPDVISQIMLAVPLWLLYEVGIWLARFVPRAAAASDYQPLSDKEMERELDTLDNARNRTGRD